METKDGQVEGTLSKVLNENAKYLRSKKNKKKELEHDAVFSQLFRYASTSDVILMAVGTIAALANGIMLPFTSFLFGDLTSAFVSQEKYADDPRYINNTYLGAGNIFHTYQDHITSADHNYTRIPHDLITKQVFLYLNHHFGMIYIYIGLSVCALSFIQTACWETACCNQISKLRQIYFTQCLRQDIAWYDERGNEDLTNKITDDMERMRDGLGSKVPVFLQAVSLMFSGLMVGFFTNWRLTLAIMIGGPCLVIASAFTAKVSSGVAAREQLRYGIAGGVASEALSSIRTICAYGGEKWELGRFSEAVAEGRKLTMSKYYSLAAGMALSIGLIYVLYGVGLWYGTELFLEDLLVPGQLFTVFMSVITGALSIGNSLPNVIEISTAIGSAAVVLDIIDSLPKIDPYSEEGLTIRDMKGEIRFSNVYFSYPTRPQVMVLSGLDLTIATGKVVAIVGASGGGKSTLVNLILRFYDPLCGKVLIDGNNVADLNVRSLRDSIGVVSQEPTLFDVSIRENIRYGRPEATTQEIEEAAKVACAHTFIESLPKVFLSASQVVTVQGYDTLVGERGLQLSGGQKQRLAIARALVRRPKILLLDEATSALDSQSESVVQAALDNASKGRTTVIIAHRLSTIRNADIIYALKDGRIAECGQHSELMEKKGIYYNLVLAQSKKSIELEEPEKKQIDVITPVEKVEPKKSLRRSLMRMSMRALGIDSADFSFQELEGLNYLQLLQLTDSPWMIFTTVAACVIAGCHMPTFSLLYGGMLGLFVLPEDEFKREVITWCILFGVLAFITAGSIATAVLASSAVTENMIKELRVKTFKNILSQQVSFFDQESHSPIKLTNILAKEPPLVKNIAGMRAGYILLTVVTTTLSVAIAFYCGWRIALIVLCFVPFIIFGNWIQMSLKFKSYIQECKTTERIAKIASESLQNIKTVQFLCLQDHMLQMFSEELKSCHGDEKKQSFVFSTTFAIVQATTYIMYGCTFNFGSDFVDEGYMTGEDIYRTVFALVIASTNLGATALFFQDFGKAKVAITNVVKLMTTRSTMPNLEEGEKPEIRGSVEFKDIIFSYPSRKHIPVLAGLSLEIPEGKTVALVGGSGCGKSTIIGLLERFYSPRKGQILVDGMNIDKISTSHLRGQIGLVTQEPTLFDCSLRENISYGISSLGRKVTDQEIIDAAKAANIHEFIASLPEGYETKVGERGSKLSGGQKQRVAIARALLRKPKILLLDEATSALDTESEKIEDDQMPSALRAVITQVQHSDEGYIPATTGGLFSLFEHLGIQAHLLCPGHVHGHSMVVQDALDNARQGRTSIVIAHRLSTVQSADLIAVISEGKVAELGTHNQLLELQGLYYDLVRCQYERN